MKGLQYKMVVHQIILFGLKADLGNITELIREAEELIAAQASYVTPVNNDAYFQNLTSNETVDYGTYDFIIVGGGTAGCVLANRLTEESFNVLVIEAGGFPSDISAVLGLSSYLTVSPWGWGFNTTAQDNACFNNSEHVCSYPRGKAVGGTSDINGAFYVRGNAKDYDLWSELGNDGWSYKEVLPYFKLSEFANITESIDEDYHGFSGPQSITIAPDNTGLRNVILEGLAEMGLEEIDYNGPTQIGYGKMQSYLTYNIRSSSNYSFLRPAIGRTNLALALNSLVTKVIISNNTAIGVEFVKDGQYYTANASKEVILSAGAVSSPQILMLSGIGPSSDLNQLGIDVIADLPVGKNLKDHVIFIGAVKFPTYDDYFNGSLEEAMDLWSEGTGPFIVNYGRVVVFSDLNNDTKPEIEVGLSFPNLIQSSGNFSVKFINPYIQVNHPASVGEVTLASNDPRDFPLINPNFLANETDLDILYEGVQILLKLNQTAAIQSISPGLTVTASVADCDEGYAELSKDWWYCYFRYVTQISNYHPIGTTRMGNSTEDSVVDANLKVHGIDRLRVVDAGVMPTPIAGHTNAPTVMLAEKISDVIIEEYS